MSQLASFQVLAQLTAPPDTPAQAGDAAGTAIAVFLFILVLSGLFGILFTPVLILEHPNSGVIKRAPIGFSWTTLFFQAWPAFFRGDFKAFFIQLITDYVFILGLFIWPFIYNRMYLNKLLERGYKVKAAQKISLERASKRLGINLPVLHSGVWSTNSPMPVQLITTAPVPGAPGHVSARQIYFHKNEQQMGPYTEQQVRDMLLSGSIHANDLAWHEGLSNWQSLSTIMQTDNVAPPPPPSTNAGSDRNIALPVFLLMLLGAGVWYFYFSGKIGLFKQTTQQTSTPSSYAQPEDTTPEPSATPSMPSAPVASNTVEPIIAGGASSTQPVDQSTPPIIVPPAIPVTSSQPPPTLPPARLSDNDVSGLDMDQTQLEINEIYGRYGVEFPKQSTQEWADQQSWYHRIPGRTPDIAEQMFTDDEKANIEVLAAHRQALRSANSENSIPSPSADSLSTMPTPSIPPAGTDQAAPTEAVRTNSTESTLDSFPVLSPENVVTTVLNTDLRITVANFNSQYSGRRVRYTGTVVRKNNKEELLVFKGGGFMATAYDVQASLREDAQPGFNDVAIGDRITIVATLDTIVPPPFGVGSNSIRLNDAQIYRSH